MFYFLTTKLNNMIQIGTACISEPMIPFEYELPAAANKHTKNLST